MKAKQKKISIMVLTMLTIVLLLVMGTLAWIEGTVTPGIDGTDMQITAAPGLVMKLDGAVTDTINLNEYCYDAPDKSLTLLEASSTNGEKIFFRRVGDAEDNTGENSNVVYLRDAVDGDVNTNYLAVTFTLTSAGKAQDIWLDKDNTYLRDQDGTRNLDAIRVSLKVDYLNDKQKQSKITLLSTHTPDERYEYSAQRAIMDFDRSNNKLVDEPGYVEDVEVFPLQGYSESNPWLHLEKDETIRITMRLWLEGMDPYCVDSISGSSFDFHLYFNSSAIQENSGT